MLRNLTVLALLAIVLAGNAIAGETERDVHILLFGGTGRLGSDIAKALVSGGYDVTVFSRATSDRKRLEGLPITFVIGDVLEEATVAAALADRRIDVVIDALNRGRASVRFYSTSAQIIARNSAKYGVQQLILNGSVGAGDSANHPDYQSLPARFIPLMKAKTEGETALMNSGVHYTIIRNNHLVKYGTPESGNAELYEDHSIAGSVTRQGLARLITGCVLKSSCYDKIYHAADLGYGKTD